MNNLEQTLSPLAQASWVDRLARQALLSLFGQLPVGQLTVREQGRIIARLGNMASELKADIDILHPRAYGKLLFGGSVGAGEAYIEQLWESSNLTQVIRLFARNQVTLERWESRFKWLRLPGFSWLRYRHKNTRRQARQNISAHYDLGNALYSRFLDDSMLYSSAIYTPEHQSLAAAQAHKLATICAKLKLSPRDHLLEIGTGWGAMAIYAAKHHGCRVTTTTISAEQYAYTRRRIDQEGLADKITLLKQDYRNLSGRYDKLVSIEMIEAVGKAYLPTFFGKCCDLLSPDGLMLLQSITIDDRRYERYAKEVDFIQKHIFPGGFLPCISAITDHLQRHTQMSLRHLEDIGLSYATTLKHWRANLLAEQQTLADLGYDERFMRLWRFYFSYCEGGFRERSISAVQLLISKPDHRDALAI